MSKRATKAEDKVKEKALDVAGDLRETLQGQVTALQEEVGHL